MPVDAQLLCLVNDAGTAASQDFFDFETVIQNGADQWIFGDGAQWINGGVTTSCFGSGRFSLCVYVLTQPSPCASILATKTSFEAFYIAR